MPQAHSVGRRRAVHIVVVLVVAGSATFLFTRGAGPSTATATRPPTRSGRRTERHPQSRVGQATNDANRGLQVESISPRNGAIDVGARAPISLEFSAPISRQSTMPTLVPSVPGSWRISGKTITFTPSEPFVPLSQVTVTVPDGSGGMLGKSSETLATPVIDTFDIEDGSTLRLQQLLSLLDYSPLAWSPSGQEISASDSSASSPLCTHHRWGASSGETRGGPHRSPRSGVQEPSTSSLVAS